jgi:hypothetical protein
MKENFKHQNRYFQRPHQSFDLMKENFQQEKEQENPRANSPERKKIERNKSALPMTCIRDDPLVRGGFEFESSSN